MLLHTILRMFSNIVLESIGFAHKSIHISYKLFTTMRLPYTLLILLHATVAFQLPNPFAQPSKKSSTVSTPGNLALEQKLKSTIGQYGRLNNEAEINSVVESLEQSPNSIPQPAIAPQVYGRWRLLHTSNANTSSPIQRKAVDASKYQIYQDIILRNKSTVLDGDDDTQELLVSQVVKFGSNFELVVDALASTSAYPIAELTERENTGKIFGLLNVLGVSKIGEEAKPDPNRPNSRIDFVFDEGNFKIQKLFNKEWTFPYPVPFRSPLFRDAVKGWIDITYLSDQIRIARGNKGTTFVLVKEDDEEEISKFIEA